MNRVKEGVFLVRKGSCTTFNKVKIRKIREKRGKIRKTWSMTKRTEIFAAKMEILSEKVILVRKNFSVPPKSAPGFRHWANVLGCRNMQGGACFCIALRSSAHKD